MKLTSVPSLSLHSFFIHSFDYLQSGMWEDEGFKREVQMRVKSNPYPRCRFPTPAVV